jgi:hypothetical protein
MLGASPAAGSDAVARPVPAADSAPEFAAVGSAPTGLAGPAFAIARLALAAARLALATAGAALARASALASARS